MKQYIVISLVGLVLRCYSGGTTDHFEDEYLRRVEAITPEYESRFTVNLGSIENTIGTPKETMEVGEMFDVILENTSHPEASWEYSMDKSIPISIMDDSFSFEEEGTTENNYRMKRYVLSCWKPTQDFVTINFALTKSPNKFGDKSISIMCKDSEGKTTIDIDSIRNNDGTVEKPIITNIGDSVDLLFPFASGAGLHWKYVQPVPDMPIQVTNLGILDPDQVTRKVGRPKIHIFNVACWEPTETLTLSVRFVLYGHNDEEVQTVTVPFRCVERDGSKSVHLGGPDDENPPPKPIELPLNTPLYVGLKFSAGTGYFWNFHESSDQAIKVEKADTLDPGRYAGIFTGRPMVQRFRVTCTAVTTNPANLVFSYERINRQVLSEKDIDIRCVS